MMSVYSDRSRTEDLWKEMETGVLEAGINFAATITEKPIDADWCLAVICGGCTGDEMCGVVVPL